MLSGGLCQSGNVSDNPDLEMKINLCPVFNFVLKIPYGIIHIHQIAKTYNTNICSLHMSKSKNQILYVLIKFIAVEYHVD